ncbi:MAG: YqaJ viral recombinase family protein [Betaproteobacteria bacterium]|nr:YqaJ viral recombinase family protein [Betaproteobacteria bacterium]
MMSAIVKLVQGSLEWHEHRAKYRNASETAIVMGESPWQTPFQLWELRTGRRQQAVNAAMARGTALEPQARSAYEALTGHVMQPLVLVEGDYSASLDGLTFEGDLLVEIKCPYKGRDSMLWKQVATGEIPAHYRWQLEHQFMVSKATKGHLYVFDGAEGLLLEVTPCPERWQAIHEAWNGFMRCIETDTPPALTDRDKVIRRDAAWQAAAEAYVQLKAEVELLAGRLDAAKEVLLGLAEHPSESGFGISVTRFWKAGSVDYKRVPELAGVDLENYRQKGRFETRVTVGK